DVDHVTPVLHRNGLVQAHGLTYFFDLLGTGPKPGDHTGRITGQDMENQYEHCDDAQQRDDGRQQAAHQVSQEITHRSAPRRQSVEGADAPVWDRWRRSTAASIYFGCA